MFDARRVFHKSICHISCPLWFGRWMPSGRSGVLLGTAMFPLLSKRFHVNAVCSPRQPPAGAVAPGKRWDKCHGGGGGPGAPQRNLCEWNGQCKRRDVPSCSHLVLSLPFVSLSRMGFAGTPVPCSAVPEGLEGSSRQIQFMVLLIPDFSPTEKHPLFKRGEALACVLPRSYTRFPVCSP